MEVSNNEDAIFEHLEKLANELSNSCISDEHWEETRELLAEKERESEELFKSITMSEEKFRMSFSL